MTADVVHIDASLIRANVSWDSLVERHVDDVFDENGDPSARETEKNGRQSGKYKKISVTDPDATMATNARNWRLEPAYKQHTAVDDKVGVILDVEVTTGQTNEGEIIEPQVDEVSRTTGVRPKAVTADAGYAYAKVYAAFEKRGIDAIIPSKAEPIRSRVPMRRFRYDAKHDILKCPKGRVLRPKRPLKYGRFSTREPGTALVARSGWIACRRGAPTRLSWWGMTTLRCFAPGAVANVGAPKTGDFISAIAGARKASMVRQSRGTAWHALLGEVSPI